MKKPSYIYRKRYQCLITCSLLVSSLFQLASPVLAQTLAGTNISNTATATYEDPNAPGAVINATSNTVQITVAEVAGITNTPIGITDGNGGSVENGDILQYNFLVSNTGNASTQVYIPSVGNITASGITASKVEISYDGTTFVDVATLSGNLSNAIAAGASITVRVTGTVTATTAGTPIKVTLGNTGLNDNSPGTQNQLDSTDGALANEIRTVDDDPTTGTNAGLPANGEREASATQQILLATASKPLALATILKTAGTVQPGATAAGNDDVIPYSLSLKVESTSSSAQFIPANLEGTPIKLDGSPVERILVSDVIPTGTVLQSVTAPAGWTAVYSTNDPATTIAAQATGVVGLTPADWTTTAPALSSVRRIGFIYTAGTSIAKGTTVSGFNFSVVTSGLPAVGGQVSNIAQVFGQTVGDATNEVVYDESGDQRPNNFNDDGTPPDATGTHFGPNADTGVANPSTQGTDPTNTNTGTGPKGEANIVNIVGTVVASDDLLNGTKNTPSAIGPNGDNDDFTNVSTFIPANTAPGTPIDPPAVTINNTIAVPATAAAPIDNITIEPIAPLQANAASGTTGLYGTNASIPTGTVVTITNPATGATATYTYDGSNFDLTSGTPVSVGTLAPGAQANYTVQVDLPPNTAQLTGYSIPIIAFAENGTRQTSNTDTTPSATGTGAAYTGETVNNVTIDRVYTGYMKLVKEARILDAAGAVKEAFSQNPTLKPLPGDMIEYRISYQNISTPVVGTGNVGLVASNFKVKENGTLNGNTWALDQNTNGIVDTVHQQNTVASLGTVEYRNGGTLIGTADPASGAAVDEYLNNVGSVNPGGTGTFQFRRKLN